MSQVEVVEVVGVRVFPFFFPEAVGGPFWVCAKATREERKGSLSYAVGKGYVTGATREFFVN